MRIWDKHNFKLWVFDLLNELENFVGSDNSHILDWEKNSHFLSLYIFTYLDLPFSP